MRALHATLFALGATFAAATSTFAQAPAPAQPAAGAAETKAAPDTEAPPPPAPDAPQTEAPTSAEAPATPAPAAEPAAAAPASSSSEEATGLDKLSYPGGIRIGGKFDAAYERAGLKNFLGDDKNAHNVLRNYHHFLFVSRHVAGDPVGFNAEVLGLNFYELTYRLAGKNPEKPWALLFKAGKILVPFGPDPLYHKQYGGLSGFDQKVLPVVWAQHGASVQLQLRFGPVGVQNDLYIVKGHRISAGNQVVDLQRDLSPDDRVRLAVGDRLALSLGPVTLWYSAYLNKVGFHRWMYLQAVDALFWKPETPVLDRFTFGVGALRADVSGAEDDGFGGKGKDYYHFADYLWVRTYVTPWLALQYRAGIHSYNNRRNFIRDDRLYDERDSSHHNVQVVGYFGHASVLLGYYWNFEKKNEVDDDFLRLLVSYDF